MAQVEEGRTGQSVIFGCMIVPPSFTVIVARFHRLLESLILSARKQYLLVEKIDVVSDSCLDNVVTLGKIFKPSCRICVKDACPWLLMTGGKPVLGS